MPVESKSVWNKLWSNPFIRLATTPFRWIGRQLKSLWEKITGSSKAPSASEEPVAPKPLPNPPVQEPLPTTRLLTPVEIEARKLQDKIYRFEDRLKKIDREPLAKKLQGEIEGLEGRYAPEQYIVELEAFIAAFEPKLVELENKQGLSSNKATKAENEQASPPQTQVQTAASLKERIEQAKSSLSTRSSFK